jgi:hypothetical protein
MRLVWCFGLMAHARAKRVLRQRFAARQREAAVLVQRDLDERCAALNS